MLPMDAISLEWMVREDHARRVKRAAMERRAREAIQAHPSQVTLSMILVVALQSVLRRDRARPLTPPGGHALSTHQAPSDQTGETYAVAS